MADINIVEIASATEISVKNGSLLGTDTGGPFIVSISDILTHSGNVKLHATPNVAEELMAATRISRARIAILNSSASDNDVDTTSARNSVPFGIVMSNVRSGRIGLVIHEGIIDVSNMPSPRSNAPDTVIYYLCCSLWGQWSLMYSSGYVANAQNRVYGASGVRDSCFWIGRIISFTNNARTSFRALIDFTCPLVRGFSFNEGQDYSDVDTSNIPTYPTNLLGNWS